MSGATADLALPRDPLAIICGGGSLPFAVADAVIGRGGKVVLFALKGWADPAQVPRYRSYWGSIGQFGRFCRLARAEGCRDVVFIGTTLRPALTQVRFDFRALKFIPRIMASLRGGDDHLLSGIARMFEQEGFHLIGAHEVAPEILHPTGALGRYLPSAQDQRDIDRALALIRAMGPFDVGQAAVIAGGYVLALEAAEGTDRMLARVEELRELGRIRTPRGRGVLVKAPKPDQDRRFDLPTIGPVTIAGIVRAGLAGVAVVAGETIIADALEVARTADQAKVFVYGASGERPASD